MVGGPKVEPAQKLREGKFSGGKAFRQDTVRGLNELVTIHAKRVSAAAKMKGGIEVGELFS